MIVYELVFFRETGYVSLSLSHATLKGYELCFLITFIANYQVILIGLAIELMVQLTRSVLY